MPEPRAVESQEEEMVANRTGSRAQPAELRPLSPHKQVWPLDGRVPFQP